MALHYASASDAHLLKNRFEMDKMMDERVNLALITAAMFRKRSLRIERNSEGLSRTSRGRGRSPAFCLEQRWPSIQHLRTQIHPGTDSE
jgi:hypothetical protein